MNDWNDILDIVTKIVALAGTLVSVVFWLQKRRAKQTEAANQQVLQARLEYLKSSLKGVATNIQLLIRRCDDDSATKGELQSMARMARTDVFAVLQSVASTERAVKEWHYGELVHSQEPDKLVEAQIGGDLTAGGDGDGKAVEPVSPD